MKYFNTIPRITYANAISSNLFYTYRLVEDIDNTYLFDYKVKTGESLESIAYNTYDDSRLWWVIALINDIYDPFFEFVIDDDIIREDAKDQATTDDVLDQDKYFEYYEILSDNNEERRNIKILSKEYLNTFLSNLISLSPFINTSDEVDEFTYEAISSTEYDIFFENDEIIETI